MQTTLFHNPACSKSRAALELLRARGVPMDVIDYLHTPPDAAMLATLAALPGLDARSLLRADDVRAAGVAVPDGDAAILELIALQPRYLQRPLFVHGARAVVGRPPERVLELL